MTKIQINSREALERLIGNDNELEIELRNSVVQNFAKSHLKPLLTDDALGKIKIALTNEVLGGLVEGFTPKGGYYTAWRFTEAGKEVFGRDIEVRVNNFLDKYFIEQRFVLEKLITNRLEKAATDIVNQIEKQSVKERLDKLVDEKIKERLGI